MKSVMPVLIPLFISAFRRADELAMAMEARCYHGGIGRTRLKELKMQRRDYTAMIIGIVIIVVLIGIKIFLPNLVLFSLG